MNLQTSQNKMIIKICNGPLHSYLIVVVFFKQIGVSPIHVRTVELVHQSAMMTSLAHVWDMSPEVFVKNSLAPNKWM